MRPYAADVLLVVHFALVAFIVGGLALTWAGAAAGWGWVRNPAFRWLHLAAIMFVALEALAGIACPLTVWEDLLRGSLRPGSFIGRWVHAMLYYRAPEWMFTTLYVAWAVASAATMWLVPPRRRTAAPG